MTAMKGRKEFYSILQCVSACLSIKSKVADPDPGVLVALDSVVLVGSGSSCSGRSRIRAFWSYPDPGVLVGSGSVVLVGSGCSGRIRIRAFWSYRDPSVTSRSGSDQKLGSGAENSDPDVDVESDPDLF